MNIFKQIIANFKSLFTPTVPKLNNDKPGIGGTPFTIKIKKEWMGKYPTSNIETTNTINPTIVQDKLVGGVQKDDIVFTRKNDLVREFAGDPPIVYEADMTTIVKQHQYGYVPKPGEVIEKPEAEVFLDDIEFLEKQPGYVRPISNITKTANYLNESQDFEERWARIKERAREEDVDDSIDGIIKENI